MAHFQSDVPFRHTTGVSWDCIASRSVKRRLKRITADVSQGAASWPASPTWQTDLRRASAEGWGSVVLPVNPAQAGAFISLIGSRSGLRDGPAGEKGASPHPRPVSHLGLCLIRENTARRLGGCVYGGRGDRLPHTSPPSPRRRGFWQWRSDEWQGLQRRRQSSKGDLRVPWTRGWRERCRAHNTFRTDVAGSGD